MSDYISREEAKAHIGNKYINILLDEIPPADVRENIHGTWEEWKVGKYEGVPICSVCKHGFPLGFNQYNFCPNCGADMRGET